MILSHLAYDGLALYKSSAVSSLLLFSTLALVCQANPVNNSSKYVRLTQVPSILLVRVRSSL